MAKTIKSIFHSDIIADGFNFSTLTKRDAYKNAVERRTQHFPAFEKGSESERRVEIIRNAVKMATYIEVERQGLTFLILEGKM